MARSFNGTTDWYGTASRQNPQSATTYSIWANPTVVNVSQILFCSAVFSGTNLVYSQLFVNSSGGINGRIELNGANYIGRTTSNSTVTTSHWQHIALTWNGGTTNAAISIYLNGAEIDNADDGAGSFIVNSASIPFYIGAQNVGTVASPTWSSGFNGSLADVTQWSVALSAAEILALAKGARPSQVRPQSLFGWWPLDGLVTVEPDLSGAVDNATVITGGPLLAPGPPVMQFTPRWPQFWFPPPAASPVVFRKTLSQIGGRVGTRQAQGWAG